MKLNKAIVGQVLILVLCVLCVSGLQAQNNTSSPYSYYGLGELSSWDAIRPTGMSSLSYYNRRGLNLNNPASLARIDSLRFILQVGAVAKFSKLTQGNHDDSFNDLNMSSLSFGFKLSSRYGIAVSLAPYTNVGYNITGRELVEGGTNYIVRTQTGTGGLNRLVWANGFQLNKNLSVGFNGIFIFGNNSRVESVNMEGGTLSHYKNLKLVSKGLHFNLGAQYQIDFLENSLMLGVKYQPKIGLSAKQFTEVVNGGIVKYTDTDRGKYDIPESYGISLGLNKGKQLWLGADYLLEKWSETQKFDKNNELLNRSKFSIASIYNANDGYAVKFLKKLTYRFGVFYDNGYIELKNERIQSKGLSFGVGMPLAREKGMFNISFEFGQLGSTKNNLVREDFSRIKLEINLFENWFVKRKYH